MLKDVFFQISKRMLLIVLLNENHSYLVIDNTTLNMILDEWSLTSPVDMKC